METVNKVVHAASTAIWGEGDQNQSTAPHGDEPISGVQGKGVFNDPYDAGNRDDQYAAPATDQDTAPKEPTADYKAPTLNDTTNDMPASTAAAGVALNPKATAGGNATENSTADTEQRSTEKSKDAGGSTEPASGASGSVPRKHEVSEEALKGPQGPAPHPASEFEDEAKRKRPAFKDPGFKDPKASETHNDAGKSGNSSSKSPGKASTGSDNSNGNGKHSTMSKVKEGLKKVAHPRHGSKSSSSS
ncbi:hypothetical protein N7532_005557 [Penicillium argentinense]|uniref:Uncharacterized protein n=1 Tax=Penicillium argentinense TaxID=1131581 RepID=A0A9W9FE64_9EURO|nr:uncharacterized protein N7532_005557 [Penicillium argentinense]KAJ5098556.1 hypothetical protein N7532_005557 [Penicillium argentinense]